MPNIFSPQQDEQFITPFSPIIGYKKLSPSFVEKLNNSMNDKLEDWSDTLVGKVKEELKFTDDISCYCSMNVSTLPVEISQEYFTCSISARSSKRHCSCEYK